MDDPLQPEEPLSAGAVEKPAPYPRLLEETVKKTLLLLTACLVLGAPQAFASEATHRAAAEEMLKLSKVDQLLTPMYDQIKATINTLMDRQEMSVEERVRAGRFSEKLVAIMAEEMSWEKMKDDFVAIYVKTYSEDEIRQINAFYRTPAGQAMIDKMPALLKASTAISQKYAQRMVERMQREFAEFEKENGEK